MSVIALNKKYNIYLVTEKSKYTSASNINSDTDGVWNSIINYAQDTYVDIPVSSRFGYIYATRNLVNGKIYLGKRSKNTLDRHYLGSGKIFLKAVKKYGTKNFVCILISWGTDVVDLNNKEKFWIHKFNAVDSKLFYNINEGGTGFGCGVNNPRHSSKVDTHGKNNPMYGVRLVGELNGNYQNYWSKEQREHLSKIKTGTKASEETRRKLSKSHKGKKYHYTEESRKAKSEKLKGKNNGMYGKKHTPEAREKMRVAHKNSNKPHYHPSEEEKLKASIRMKKYYETHVPPNKGVPMSVEQRVCLQKCRSNRKPVKCLETGKVYGSLNEASRLTGLDKDVIKLHADAHLEGRKLRKCKYNYTWVYIDTFGKEDPYASYKSKSNK